MKKRGEDGKVVGVFVRHFGVGVRAKKHAAWVLVVRMYHSRFAPNMTMAFAFAL